MLTALGGFPHPRNHRPSMPHGQFLDNCCFKNLFFLACFKNFLSGRRINLISISPLWLGVEVAHRLVNEIAK